MVVCIVVFDAWWADSTYMRARFPQILAIQLIRQIVKGAAFGQNVNHDYQPVLPHPLKDNRAVVIHAFGSPLQGSRQIAASRAACCRPIFRAAVSSFIQEHLQSAAAK